MAGCGDQELAGWMMEPVVSELYLVFNQYRLGNDFVGCEDCVSSADSDHLRSKGLRELTVSDINRYAFKATTTWGEVHHFKYFLPRLLELSLEELDELNFPEVLFGKLEYAQWKTWPEIEQNAVQEFLLLFSERHLWGANTSSPEDDITTPLGCLAATGLSLNPFLYRWITIDTKDAADRLSHFIDQHGDLLLSKGRLDLLWEDPEWASHELIRWLASEAVRKYLLRYKDRILADSPFVFSYLDALQSAFGPSLEDES